MVSDFFVKNYKILEENENLVLQFSQLLNKIEMDFKALNQKYEDLKNRIDAQHLENIRSDEILLEHCRNFAEKNFN